MRRCCSTAAESRSSRRVLANVAAVWLGHVRSTAASAGDANDTTSGSPARVRISSSSCETRAWV